MLRKFFKMCDFQELFWEIEKICINKSLLPLSVSDLELSVEPLEALSELNLVQEVTEVSLDSDSEISQSECGILMAKSVMFWIPILTVLYVHNQHSELSPSSTCISIGNVSLEKLGGHKSAKPFAIYTRDRKVPISLLLSFPKFYGALL